eukprot:SAG31_NODE_16700_length_699_cov_0.945000_1_plen_89_part_10
MVCTAACVAAGSSGFPTHLVRKAGPSVWGAEFYTVHELRSCRRIVRLILVSLRDHCLQRGGGGRRRRHAVRATGGPVVRQPPQCKWRAR